MKPKTLLKPGDIVAHEDRIRKYIVVKCWIDEDRNSVLWGLQRLILAKYGEYQRKWTYHTTASGLIRQGYSVIGQKLHISEYLKNKDWKT